jgi:hypothetical protein
MRRPEHRASRGTVGASLSHRPRGTGGGGGGFIFRHASTGRFGRPEGGAKRVERASSRITTARIHQRRLCMKRLRVTPAKCFTGALPPWPERVAHWWNKSMDGLFHTYPVPHISSPEAMPVGRGNPWHSHRPTHWWNKSMDGLFHTYHRRKRCRSAVGILGIRTGRPTGGTRPWMACSTHIQTAAPAGGLGATCGGAVTKPEDS